MPSAKLGLLLVLAVTASGDLLRAGQDTQVPSRPMFRAEVEYVEVDVVATDKDGRFASGLQKDDFVIKEDGKTQPITSFATVNVPLEQAPGPLFSSQPMLVDASTNERPFDGRVYVLLFDDLHVDASRSQRARTIAKDFIQRVMAPKIGRAHV